MSTVSTNQTGDGQGLDEAPIEGPESADITLPMTIDRRYERVIQRGNDSVIERIREAFVWRDLLFMLVQRDIKVRYRQTMFGVIWAILVPLMSLSVYWFVFERLLQRGDRGNLAYPLFLFPAMILWHYFNSSVGRAANALKHDAPILSKIYFPRLLLPFSNVISPIIDFLFGLAILMIILAIYQHPPTFSVLLLPLYIVLACVAATGMGLGLSVLNAHYRDVHHFLPIMLQLWFFCSPVLYSAMDLVPENLRLLYAVNPMVTACEGARSALLGIPLGVTPGMVVVSVCSAVMMFLVGLLTFMKFEQTVTDVL